MTEGVGMMLSRLLAPNTPEWLLITVSILSFGLIFVFLVWAAILEIRYIDPYTLIKTSNQKKWRKATVLAFLYTAMIPILGIAAPIISPLPGQWPRLPLMFGGVWIVVLPLAILYKRLDFEWQIKNYYRLDKMIKKKDGAYYRTVGTALSIWPRIFMPADLKRFFSEGFSENVDDNDDGSNGKMEKTS
jgi:hypothetical protein